MLETIDIGKKIEKEAYREWFPRLKGDLRDLQQLAREHKIPIMIIIEGWHLAGCADAIKHLGEALDPRGFVVHSVETPSLEEQEREWQWRFWIRLPPRGKIAVFEGSWYSRVLGERVNGTVSRNEWEHAYLEINQAEDMLSRDGMLIVKLFLHISKKEQKRRLKEAEKDILRAQPISKEDWKLHDQYKAYEKAVEEMLERTSTHYAPWVLIEAEDHRYRRLKIFQTVCESIANAIKARKKQTRERARPLTVKEVDFSQPLTAMPSILDKVDLTKCLTPEQYESKKLTLQVKLRKLQLECIKRALATVIVYEGWDASGKGGSIRRLTAALDPRFYQVVPIGKPSPEELAHHYLWRFWRYMPRWGHLTIFDRSWYGRVLVERIEGLCRESEWRRAYQEINQFEMQLFRSNLVLIKFWIHITPEEQLRRFNAREGDPHKRHKLTDEDWRNRDKWPAYQAAVEEMVQRTSTSYAPWTIIEGDCKRWARVRAMETTIATLEKAVTQAKKRGDVS